MKKGRGLKIGVIGVGSMGQNHARVLASYVKGVQLVAIADANETLAAEVAGKYAVESLLDYHAILPLVEAVIVATPTSTHFSVGKECLEAGKHVLIEKPLAPAPAEALALAELAKSKGLVLAVGLIERFNPAFTELRKLIRKEKIIGINIKRTSPFPTRITDANVVQDMMIHDLDLLNVLLAHDEIETLTAEGKKVKTKNLDFVSATVHFTSGVVARVVADRVADDKIRKISVTTEDRMVEADLLNKQVYVRDLKHAAPSVHHVKNCDQLTEELTNFVVAIKNHTNSEVDAFAGYRATKLAEEVEKACS
ncbi:MAG: Gfo/Idh/MocA family oxidoreductase [Candidatus Margulisiibacteriota bacterium]